MKEATGDLNSSVIVVISVGILSAFFFTVLWPMIHNNMQKNINCDKAICNCKEMNGDRTKCKCEVKDDDGNVVIDDLWCPYKG